MSDKIGQNGKYFQNYITQVFLECNMFGLLSDLATLKCNRYNPAPIIATIQLALLITAQ